MPIVLYELAGANPAVKFSPYCWRIRMALAHKELAVRSVAWHFVDKEMIAFSGQSKVPVVVDGERTISDSWAIAEYLEDAYRDRPSLFGGAIGRGEAFFVNGWVDSTIQPMLSTLIVRDVLDAVAPDDRAYFRSSREARFGRTLEEVQAGRETRVLELRRLLSPVRRMLRQQDYFGGLHPSYADYILFGSLQWARCTSRFQLLEADDPVNDWFNRVGGLFDGLGASAPRA